MKKSIISIAALAAVGAASAQSSVTLYGVVDAAIGSYRATGAGSRTQVFAGGSQNSRLGFRGREDLGGGLYAGFELEAGLFNDSGTSLATNTNNQPSGAVAPGGLMFARKSFVAVGNKSWGEIRLGRDYTPGFWNLFAYDAFRTGVGLGGITTQGGATTVFRASNSIGYFTPGCSVFVCQGFFGQAMYAMGENTSGAANSDDGRYVGVRVGYGAPKWDVAAAHGVTKNVAAGDYTQTNVGWRLRLRRGKGDGPVGRAQDGLAHCSPRQRNQGAVLAGQFLDSGRAGLHPGGLHPRNPQRCAGQQCQQDRRRVRLPPVQAHGRVWHVCTDQE